MASTASFTISLDLELYWGVCDKLSIDDYRANLDGARAATLRLLELFERRGVHATWAVVGLLICADVDEARAASPPADDRPRYVDMRMDPYAVLERTARRDHYALFAPELVDAIRAVPGQELGTHTFGHIYALEPGMTAQAFEADLRAAIAIGRRRGFESRSIVFPRNQVSEPALDACARHGVCVYRGQPRHPLYAPSADGDQVAWKRAGRLLDAYLPIARRAGWVAEHGDRLVNTPATAFLRPVDARSAGLDPVRLERLKREMRAAAARGQSVHLWWHPHNFGVHTDANLAFLDALVDEAAALGLDMRTMAELADEAMAA